MHLYNTRYIHLNQHLDKHSCLPFLSVGITSVISISWLGNLFGHGIFFETLANLVPRKWILISYIEAAKDYGFKKWDVYAMFIFWLPSVLIPVVFYFLYNRLGNKMSEFVRQYVELGSLITGLAGSR